MPATSDLFRTGPGIVGPTTGSEGSPLTYTAKAYTNDGGIWEVRFRKHETDAWTGYLTGSGKTFTFTPRDDGQYRIELKAKDPDESDPNKAWKIGARQVQIANLAPEGVKIVAPDRVPSGRYIAAFVTGSDPANDEDELHYDWHVKKNGAAYTLPVGTATDKSFFGFTYALAVGEASATFKLSTKVSDGDGGETEVSKTVVVAGTPVDGQDPIQNVTEAHFLSSRFLDMVRQPDGKLVAVGFAAETASASTRLFVARFNDDLSHDELFGEVNVATGKRNGHTLFGATGPNQTLYGVALTRDGRILVSGTTNVAGGQQAMIARLTSTGELDSTFGGGDGIVTLNPPNTSSSTEFHGLAIHPNGTIVAVGTEIVGPNRSNALIAYVSNSGVIASNAVHIVDVATLDDFLPAYRVDRSSFNGVAIQRDGKAVVVGERLASSNIGIYEGENPPPNAGGGGGTGGNGTGTEVTKNAALIARFTESGQLDPSFGGGPSPEPHLSGSNGSILGLTQTPIGGGGFDSLHSVSILPSGEILAVGSSDVSHLGKLPYYEFPREIVSGKLALVKYGSTGTPVTTGFGSQGIVTTNLGFDSLIGNDALIQADGKIVVGGASNSRLVAARFTATGQSDDTFFNDGVIQRSWIECPLTGEIDTAACITAIAGGVALAGGEGIDLDLGQGAVVVYRPPQAQAPTLVATANKGNHIDLNWRPGPYGVQAGYVLERSETLANDGQELAAPKIITITAPDITSFEDVTAEPGVRYYYRVHTFGANGPTTRTAHSNIANATTLPKDVGWDPVDTIHFGLNEVRGAIASSHVSLDANETYRLRATGRFDLGYNMDGSKPVPTDAEWAYFKSGNEDWERVAWLGELPNWGIRYVDANAHTIHDQPIWGDISSNSHFMYEIGYTAPASGGPLKLRVDDDYYSDNELLTGDYFEDPLQVVIYGQLPATPSLLTATVDRPNKIVNLSWQDGMPRQQKRYFVQRAKEGGDFETIGSLESTIGQKLYAFNDPNVELNKQYRYRVMAKKADGLVSRNSNEAAVVLINHPPEITPIPTQYVRLGHEFEYQIVASDAEDGSGVTYSASSNLHPSLHAEDSGKIIGFRPTVDDVGHSYAIDVTVTDRDVTPSRTTFPLFVLPSNDKPVVVVETSQTSHADSKGVALHALARDENPGATEGQIKYTWRVGKSPVGATPPTLVGVNGENSSKNIDARFERAGTYEFIVRAVGLSGNWVDARVTVEVQQIYSSVDISSTTTVLSPGDSELFTASKLDQFGKPIPISTEEPTFTWKIGNAVVGTGETYNFVASASDLGNKTLEASLGGKSQTVTVTVEVSSLNAAPSYTADATDKQRMTLGANPSGNSPFTYLWKYKPGATPSNLPVPRIETDSKADTSVQFFAPGSYEFEVTVHDAAHHRVTRSVTVPITSLVERVHIDEGVRAVVYGNSIPLTASGFDQFERPINLSTLDGGQTATWAIDTGDSGTFLNGVNTGGSVTFVAPTGTSTSPDITSTIKLTYSRPGLETSLTSQVAVTITRTIPTTVVLTRVQNTTMDGGIGVLDRDGDVEGIIDFPQGSGVTLSKWDLVATPVLDGAQPIVIARGSNNVAADVNGAGRFIATLRPAMLADGLYDLKIVATQGNGVEKSSGLVRVRVRTDVKLGNFTLPATDLSLPSVAGIPINISRVYDSSRANEKGDFGYGWRLDGPDIQYRITARTGSHATHIEKPGFRRGDLVYITLPGGQQQVFMFDPDPMTWNPLNTYFKYKARFTAVDGSASKLDVPETILGLDRDEFFFDESTNANQGYNPGLESNRTLTLTTQDKTVFTIKIDAGDTRKAKLTRIVDANSNYVDFDTPGQINSNASAQHAVVTKTGVLITNVGSSASSDRINYTYSADGDLIDVKDRRGMHTTYEYANRLVRRGGEELHSFFSVQDNTGKYWNATAGQFQSGTGSWGLKNYPMDGAGGLWTAKIPTGIADGTVLTVAYWSGAGTAVPTDFDETTGIGEETRDYRNVRDHFLIAVLDPDGKHTLTAKYNAGGQLESLVDASGKAAPIDSGGFDGEHAVSSVTDLAGNKTIFVYDKHGNVEREIKVVSANGTTIDKYIVTAHHYQYAPVGSDQDGADTSNALMASYDFAPFELLGTATQEQLKDGLPRDGLVTMRFASYEPVSRTLSFEWVRSESVRPPESAKMLITQYLGYQHGKPLKVIDPYGNITEYHYNGDTDNLEWTINPAGEKTSYTYDSAGRLTTTKRSTTSADEITLSTNDYFDGANGTAAWKGLLKSTTDNVTDVKTSYTYDDQGRAYQVFKEWPGQPQLLQSTTTYDNEGRVETSTDEYAKTTTNHYDSLGRLAWTEDPRLAKTFYVYDVRGNLVRMLYPDKTETRTVYDVMGRATWTSDRFYSGVQNVTSTAPNVLANATRTIYDSIGRAVGSERYERVVIAMGTETDLGTPTTIAPDISNQAIAAMKFSESSTVYDAQGRVAETKDARGTRTGSIYYGDGRVKVTGQLRANAKVGGPYTDTTTDSDFVTKTSYEYETFDGRLMQPDNPLQFNHGEKYAVHVDAVTDARGHKTTTEYDNLGRATKVTYADGSYATTAYAAFGKTVTKTAQRTPADDDDVDHVPLKITTNKYDNAGRLLSVELPDLDPGAAENRPKYEYTYDKNGNELTQKDALGHTTTFDYDLHGRRIQRRLPDVVGKPNAIETWTYDSFGRVDAHKDFKGQVTRYEYDDVDPGAGGRLKEEWRFEHDTIGNVNVITAALTSLLKRFAPEHTEYRYDSLGRQSSVREYGAHLSNDQYTLNRVEASQYDPITGATTARLTYVNGHFPENNNLPDEQIHYEFDNKTGDHTATWTPYTRTEYGYDDLGRLKTTKQAKVNGAAVFGNNVTSYTYDEVGSLKTVSLPNGNVTTYDYDTLNRLTHLKTVHGTTSVFEQTYGLSSDGQRLTNTEDVGSDHTVVTWTYDALNRLHSEEYNGPGDTVQKDFTDVYTYDVVGNRLHKSHDAYGTTADDETAYEYNVRDQLKTESHVRPSTSQTPTYTVVYTYDDNGSLETSNDSRPGVDTETRFYDLRNKLIGVDENADANHAFELAYQYDVDGNRVAKFKGTNGTVSTELYYSIDANNPTGYSQVVEESPEIGSAPVITYAVGGDVISQTPGASEGMPTVYFQYDGHGSVRGLASTGGEIPSNAHLDFDAFGNALFNTSTIGTKLGYGGERWEEDLGAIELRARDYRPSVGSFNSFDSFEADSSEPAQLHKYVYACADPINRIDPTGRSSIIPIVTLAAICIALLTIPGDTIPGSQKPASPQIGVALTNVQRPQVVTADRSAIATLRAVQAALVSPNDETLLRVAHFFSPADASMNTIPTSERKRLMKLAKEIEGTIDELLGEMTSNGGNTYRFDKSIPPTEFGRTDMFDIAGFDIDQSTIRLGPSFFLTDDRQRSLTVIHESMHGYFQAVDDDADGMGKSIEATEVNGRPVYTQGGVGVNVNNRQNHAETWALFCDYWYVP